MTTHLKWDRVSMAAIKRKQRWKANVVAATKTDHEEPVRVPPVGRPPHRSSRQALIKLPPQLAEEAAGGCAKA